MNLLLNLVWALGVITLLIVTLVLFFAVYLIHVRRRYAHIPGPPLDNFFLGHIPSLKRCYDRDEYAHILFLEWAECYGPIFKVFTLHQVMLIPTSEPLLQEFLIKSQYPKAKMIYERFATICGVRFLGTGLVSNLDHRTWEKRRNAIDPAFHKKHLQGMMGWFNEVGDEWIETLKAVADGKTMIKLADSLIRVTLDAVGKVAFDADLGSLRNEDSPFPDAIKTLLDVMCVAARDPLYMWWPWHRELRARGRKAVHFLRSYGRWRLDARQKQLLAGEDVPQDLLTHLLKLAGAVDGLTTEDLLDDFDTLFIAGQETTSNVLSFLFGEIGRRPDILERLREEVASVLGARTEVYYSDLGRLPYMHQVWQETLRLYPPAPGTARDVTMETTVGDITIPANSCIVISFYVAQRMEMHFKDAGKFSPERFGPGQHRPQYAYCPFSLGQRSCVGRQFAQIESKILVCKFLQNFDYVLDPDQSFEVLETTSLKPRGGTAMTLISRS